MTTLTGPPRLGSQHPRLKTLVAGRFASVGYPAQPPSWKEAMDTVRLHLCVQWLGTPTGWVPPSTHTDDWVAEALDLAERV
jgi:hypothetical protein